MLVAVWANEDQSDLQWLELQISEDGNYVMDINMATFDYIPGGYNMHVYAVTTDGEQYFIGGEMKRVE